MKQIERPLEIEDASELVWDEIVDVVVAGFGGAGAVAALQANQEGATVLIAERFDGGGATSFSGGIIYASGTTYQRDAGIEDTPAEMFNYLKAEEIPVTDKTLRQFCEQSATDLEWLAGHGIPYGGNAYLDKTAFPPDGHWLYYSGNENTERFRPIAKPAPRGHRVVTPGNGGWLHYQKLQEAVSQAEIRVLKHAPVTRLVANKAGEVIGVELSMLPEDKWDAHRSFYDKVDPWKPFNNTRVEKTIAAASAFEGKFGVVRRIRAHSGVILATGGFVNNLDMLAVYQPEVARSCRGLLRLGALGCDGSGIEMGQSVGGVTTRMDRMFVGSPLSPPVAYVERGILVNKNGQRFVAEDAYHAEIGNVVVDQPNGQAWLVIESQHFWRAMRQSLFPGKGLFKIWGLPPLINAALGGTKRAGTIGKLARKIGVDSIKLAATVASYNSVCNGTHSDRFGKSKDKLHPIGNGPFYAVNFSIDNFWYPSMAMTLGGLAVDEGTGGVLRANGSIIKGLYAIGRAAVGLCSNTYMSGMSIADTVFSGRRAGRHAGRKRIVR